METTRHHSWLYYDHNDHNLHNFGPSDFPDAVQRRILELMHGTPGADDAVAPQVEDTHAGDDMPRILSPGDERPAVTTGAVRIPNEFLDSVDLPAILANSFGERIARALIKADGKFTGEIDGDVIVLRLQDRYEHLSQTAWIAIARPKRA